jgi:D-glycero-alpha-D-manno-heptose-7-phosphate kinase
MLSNARIIDHHSVEWSDTVIISKTPFRVSLFGGSTDYESYYSKHGATLIGFALDKYCYEAVRITPKILGGRTKIVYSKTEIVDDNNDIQHNGVRGVLHFLNIKNGIEIFHLSDLPSQTGIGSSSSFIVGLLNALQSLDYGLQTRMSLAKDAIHIERNLLKEAGGCQDQIWAAYGGLNSIHIDNRGHFDVRPLPVGEDFIADFLDRSILIYTGNTRMSYEVAQAHDGKKKDDIAELAQQGLRAFYLQDIDAIGLLLLDAWKAKKKISPIISSPEVDTLYNELLDDGMIGGKLLGSGGSGFIFGIAGDNKKPSIRIKYADRFVEVGISKQGSIIL